MIYLIKNYINKIDKNDIVNYLNRYDIYLNEYEVNILYNHLKNNWYTFLYEDNTLILNDIKNNIDNDKYIKLYNLYKEMYNKYHNYL